MLLNLEKSKKAHGHGYIRKHTSFDWYVIEHLRPKKCINIGYRDMVFGREVDNVVSFCCSQTFRRKTTVESRFLELAAKWKNETRGLSLAASKINNEFYLQIIELGKIHSQEIIKLIMKDLLITPSYWHYALRKITNENPIPKGLNHVIDITSKKWLQWGIEHNYID